MKGQSVDSKYHCIYPKGSYWHQWCMIQCVELNRAWTRTNEECYKFQAK